ncbi:hypothetical protein VTJ04DRAFT_1511 [Mycothermus thermophilus]|uniref:uncharacterized protein n=1 Tax=Humicola insolens TaxID=85995 RepID=UPI0037433CD0
MRRLLHDETGAWLARKGGPFPDRYLRAHSDRVCYDRGLFERSKTCMMGGTPKRAGQEGNPRDDSSFYNGTTKVRGMESGHIFQPIRSTIRGQS